MLPHCEDTLKIRDLISSAENRKLWLLACLSLPRGFLVLVDLWLRALSYPIPECGSSLQQSVLPPRIRAKGLGVRMRFWLTLLLCAGLSMLAVSLAAAADGATPATARDANAAQDPDIQALKALLTTPEKRLDLAKAKIAIDRMIDPEADARATLEQLDTLAARIKARFPVEATNQTKLELLVTSLAQPGPWNDYRPFSYDLDDPFGKDIRNKLLSTYLATRKGNCVSMPILMVILGEKLGLDMTLATAPEHVLVKFRNDQGQWINIEATSFGTKRDAGYQQEMGITPKAMANGIYLRPLSKRESVGVMLSTLMEFYRERGKYTHQLAVADLALQANPKDTVAMLHKGSAYYKLMKTVYMDRFPTQAAIPPGKQAEFANLRRSNMLWFQKAEALGWVEPTAMQDANYLQAIQRTKTGQRGTP